MKLLLASRSPRRSDLLTAAGFVFEVDRSVAIDETPAAGEPPSRYVARLAEAKARAAFLQHPHACVLGADTAVVVGRMLLGKPADARAAAAMLERLSGRTHRVLTGVSVRCARRHARAVETTRVRFARLSPAEIAWYVASGEPEGKAGAYAIQGLAARFILAIEGSYSNVVGLPIATTCRLLAEVGYPVEVLA